MANPASTAPPRECPECGKSYRGAYFHAHMRKAHGIYGGDTGVVRNQERYPTRTAVAAEYHRPDEGTITVPIKANTSPRFKVLDSMKVLVDQDGALWIGEKIRD